MKITIDLDRAASFIANLVKEGLTFEANQYGDRMTIILTGGF